MDDLAQLHAQIDAFVDAHDWGRYHTPKNLAMALTGEVGELVEILQWLTPEEAAAAGTDSARRTALEDELADVFIYLTCLARSLDIDLVDAAIAKVARNEERFPVRSDPES